MLSAATFSLALSLFASLTAALAPGIVCPIEEDRNGNLIQDSLEKAAAAAADGRLDSVLFGCLQTGTDGRGTENLRLRRMNGGKNL